MSDPKKPVAPATKPTTQKWYPTPEESGGHAQWNIHRQVLDSVYSLQDKVEAMGKAPASTAPAQSFPNETHNTKIAGLNVSPNTPTNGQTLKYNSTTGMIEWS